MPPRPRITKPRLAWKRSRSGDWVPYHRVTWGEGGKRKERAIRLDWRGDPQRLDELYWACEAGRHARQKQEPKYSWKALIIEWRKDPRVQKKLADGTKRSYRLPMDRIMEKNGDKDVRRTTRQAVRAAHDKLAATPRTADRYLQTISLLWNYGRKKLDWPLGENPAEGIDHFGKQREYEPWPEWMVGKLDDAPETVRIAAELILGTGQRPNAAIRMEWSRFNGEWMMARDEKQATDFEVFCPAPLRDFLATVPKRGAYVLAKNLRAPLGYDAVEKAFRTWRNGLGPAAKPYSLHGLRKLAIVRMAEAGWSDAEIQAATNQTPETIAYYRAKASRKVMSRRAHERRE